MANFDETISTNGTPIPSPSVSIKQIFSDLISIANKAFLRGVFWGADYTMPEDFSGSQTATAILNDPEHPITDVVLFPLTLIGVCMGLTVLPLLYYPLYTGKHCAISFYRSFALTTNAAMKDMFTMKENQKTLYQLIPLKNEKETRSEKQIVAGLIGRIVGSSLGLVLFITIIILRAIQNTPEHTFRIFCRGVRFMLSKNTPTHTFFTLKPDKRVQEESGYGLSYSLGIFGIFPLGVISGILGLIVGIGLRIGIGIKVQFYPRQIKKMIYRPENEPLLENDKHESEDSLDFNDIMASLKLDKPEEIAPLEKDGHEKKSSSSYRDAMSPLLTPHPPPPTNTFQPYKPKLRRKYSDNRSSDNRSNNGVRGMTRVPFRTQTPIKNSQHNESLSQTPTRIRTGLK